MRALAVVVLMTLSAPAAAQDDVLAPIAVAVRRHADGDALEAIAHLPAADRERPRTRYLLGRLLERGSRMREAAAAFPTGEAAAGLPDDVRADSERRAGVAAARSGDCARARTLLEPRQADPVVQAQLAECSLAEGDLDRAARELRAVDDRGARAVDGFAARFALAEALARAGRTADAVSLLTSLVVERVDHPEVDRAEAALAALHGGPVALSFTQQMRRAERLDEVHRYAEAAAAFEAIGRPTRAPELRRWLHARGMALYRERHHYADAAAVLAESARAGGATAADDQFHAARALSRADRDPEAIREYRRFAREHASHRLAPEAMYLAAWLELRHDLRGGEANMARFARSAAARRQPGLQQEATWQLGLRSFEQRRWAAAERHLTEYARMDAGPMVRARAQYWIGRTRQARGDRAGAIAAYRDALYVEPLHWYALLARQRIEELGAEAPPPFPEPALTGTPTEVEVTLPPEARFYASLGLRQDALDVIRQQEARLRRGPDGLQRLVMVYQRLGEAGRVARLVGGVSTLRRRNAPGPMDRWRWDGAFPRPYAREVSPRRPRAGSRQRTCTR